MMSSLGNQFSVETPIALLDMLEHGVIDKDIELTSDMFQKQIIDTAGWKFGDSPVRNQKLTIINTSASPNVESHALDNIVHDLFNSRSRKRTTGRRTQLINVEKSSDGQKNTKKKMTGKRVRIVDQSTGDEAQKVMGKTKLKNDKSNLGYTSNKKEKLKQASQKSTSQKQKCSEKEKLKEASQKSTSQKQKYSEKEKLKEASQKSTSQKQKCSEKEKFKEASQKSTSRKKKCSENNGEKHLSLTAKSSSMNQEKLNSKQSLASKHNSSVDKKRIQKIGKKSSEGNRKKNCDKDCMSDVKNNDKTENIQNLTCLRLPHVYPVLSANDNLGHLSSDSSANGKESDLTSVNSENGRNLNFTASKTAGRVKVRKKELVTSTANDNITSSASGIEKHLKSRVGDLNEQFTTAYNKKEQHLKSTTSENQECINQIENEQHIKSAASENEVCFNSRTNSKIGQFTKTANVNEQLIKSAADENGVYFNPRINGKTGQFTTMTSENEHLKLAANENEGCGNGLYLSTVNQSVKNIGITDIKQNFVKKDSVEFPKPHIKFPSVQEIVQVQGSRHILTTEKAIKKINIIQPSNEMKCSAIIPLQTVECPKSCEIGNMKQTINCDEDVAEFESTCTETEQESELNVSGDDDEMNSSEDSAQNKTIIQLKHVLSNLLKSGARADDGKVDVKGTNKEVKSGELPMPKKCSFLKHTTESHKLDKVVQMLCTPKSPRKRKNSKVKVKVENMTDAEMQKEVGKCSTCGLICVLGKPMHIHEITHRSKINLSCQDNPDIDGELSVLIEKSPIKKRKPLKSPNESTHQLHFKHKSDFNNIMDSANVDCPTKDQNLSITQDSNQRNYDETRGSTSWVMLPMKLNALDTESVPISVHQNIINSSQCSREKLNIEIKQNCKNLAPNSKTGSHGLLTGQKIDQSGISKKKLQTSSTFMTVQGHKTNQPQVGTKENKIGRCDNFVKGQSEKSNQSQLNMNRNRSQLQESFVQGQGFLKEVSELKTKPNFFANSCSDQVEKIEDRQNFNVSEQISSVNGGCIKSNGSCIKGVKVIVVKDSLSQEQLEVSVPACQCENVKTCPDNSVRNSHSFLSSTDSNDSQNLENVDEFKSENTAFKQGDLDLYKSAVQPECSSTDFIGCARTHANINTLGSGSARTSTYFKHFNDLVKHNSDENVMTSESFLLPGNNYSGPKKNYFQSHNHWKGNMCSNLDKENCLHEKGKITDKLEENSVHFTAVHQVRANQARIEELKAENSFIISPPKKRWRNYVNAELDHEHSEQIDTEIRSNKSKRSIDFESSKFGSVTAMTMDRKEVNEKFSHKIDSNAHEHVNTSVCQVNSDNRSATVHHDNRVQRLNECEKLIQGQNSTRVKSSLRECTNGSVGWKSNDNLSDKLHHGHQVQRLNESQLSLQGEENVRAQNTKSKSLQSIDMIESREVHTVPNSDEFNKGQGHKIEQNSDVKVSVTFSKIKQSDVDLDVDTVSNSSQYSNQGNHNSSPMKFDSNHGSKINQYSNDIKTVSNSSHFSNQGNLNSSPGKFESVSDELSSDNENSMGEKDLDPMSANIPCEFDLFIMQADCARLLPFSPKYYQCARVIPVDFNNSARTRPICSDKM